MCTSGNGTLERVEHKDFCLDGTWISLCWHSAEGGQGFVSLLLSMCASALLSSFLSAWASHALKPHFALCLLGHGHCTLPRG